MVDVRDMLCAQALAVIAKAFKRLAPGETLEIMGSGKDVLNDAIAWATIQASMNVEGVSGEGWRMRVVRQANGRNRQT